MKARIFIKTPEEIIDILGPGTRENQAFTAITNGTVGIATREEPGYTPTYVGLEIYNYDKLQALCDQANLLMYPDRSLKETMLIVMSSMRVTNQK